MKELVKQYIDQGISRRTLMANLSAAGLSAVAANTVAQALAPVSARAAAASPGAALLSALRTCCIETDLLLLAGSYDSL